MATGAFRFTREYPIQLGWTVSAPVFAEMQRQLAQNYPLPAMARALAGRLDPAHVAAAETSPH